MPVMTCEFTLALRFSVSFALCMESSWRNAGEWSFTISVWFFMKISPVTEAIYSPTTSGHAAMRRRWRSGVSSPDLRRNSLRGLATWVSLRLNIVFNRSERFGNGSFLKRINRRERWLRTSARWRCWLAREGG